MTSSMLSAARDGWTKPSSAGDDQCHLMVECMESWFLADMNALANYFGQGFLATAMPSNTHIERIPKSSVFYALKKATKDTKTKGAYAKGDHSFKILQAINPGLVTGGSPWAKRFVEYMLSV